MTTRLRETTFGSISVHVERLPAGTARSLKRTDGSVQLVYIHSGRVEFIAAKTAVTLTESQGALIQPGSRAMLRAEQGSRVCLIAGPAEWVTQGDRGAKGCQVIRASGLLSPAVAFALGAVRTPAAAQSPVSSYFTERLLLEMLQGLLAEMTATPTPLSTRDPFPDALAVLSTRYADAGLTSQSVADAVRLSKRQLERIFADHGTTIRGTLRQIRLQHARAMLSSADYGAMSTGWIAQHVGFSSASSLARALRDAGHGTPSELRPVNLGMGDAEPQ